MVLFAASRGRADDTLECAPCSGQDEVHFSLFSATAPGRPASANRFNFASRQQHADHVYTDNTAQAFVSRGTAPSRGLVYEVYVRRRPYVQVRVFHTRVSHSVLRLVLVRKSATIMSAS
jgi:hypothetical protein